MHAPLWPIAAHPARKLRTSAVLLNREAVQDGQ
jgi:hypothetical protein